MSVQFERVSFGRKSDFERKEEKRTCNRESGNGTKDVVGIDLALLEELMSENRRLCPSRECSDLLLVSFIIRVRVSAKIVKRARQFEQFVGISRIV